MPLNPITSQLYPGGVADQIFTRIQRLEAQVQELIRQVATLQANVGSSARFEASYGTPHAPRQSMSIQEFKALFGRDPMSMMGHQDPPPPPAPEPLAPEPHPATKTSFVLKI